MEHFKYSNDAEVVLVLCNNPDAYVLQRADNFEIPSHVFDRHEFYHTDEIVTLLKRLEVDLIALAGFLWLVPANLLQAYPNKIINIHPSLLPKYGGKGMYGDRVHQAVLDAKDEEHGIAIHFVDQNVDGGETNYHGRFKVEAEDNLEELEFKGQRVELLHFPKVLENIVEEYGLPLLSLAECVPPISYRPGQLRACQADI